MQIIKAIVVDEGDSGWTAGVKHDNCAVPTIVGLEDLVSDPDMCYCLAEGSFCTFAKKITLDRDGKHVIVECHYEG